MKIVINEDGTTTITGIHYRDLRSILTGSQFYRSGNINPDYKIRGGNAVFVGSGQDRIYMEHNVRILKELQTLLDTAIKNANAR